MIKSNTTELRNILAKVNALPEADDLTPPEPVLQEKVVTPTKSTQEVAADTNYDGLSKVTVNPIPSEYIVPSGSKDITTNGTHDVTEQKSVNVNVPIPDGYILPEGTLDITENKLYNVTDKAYVDVNVPIPEGYIKPSGNLSITANGSYNVTDKASVSVAVPSEDPVLQEKTVTPSTSTQTVTPDSTYDGLSKVTVNAMPTATQATPVITVDTSSGLITAKSTQSAGYVSAGTKTATQQLVVQSAKTITPTTSSQIAVAKGIYTTGDITVAAIPSSYVKPSATKGATTYTPTTTNQTISSGTYLTGTQTIKGDSNLVAGNIKKGTSIFGVSGSFEAGEDVTAETNTYTDLLDELEGAVNDLPEAKEDPVIEPLTVTTNGTYTPPNGVTGYSPVTVNVAIPSSPGARIETVTLIVEKGEAAPHSPMNEPYVHYTTVERGVITYKKLKTPLNSTHELTVVKNSLVLATNTYEDAVADSEWGSDRTLTGGWSDDVWASGASKFVGVYWANQDFTLYMD